MNAVNEQLRAHVTSAKFVLSLGGMHIAALVWLDHKLRHDNSTEEEMAAKRLGNDRPRRDHPLHRAFNLMVPGMNGLVSRGLATHTSPVPRNGRSNTMDYKPSEIWTITDAGRAAIVLLREAGIWQEYADALPPVEMPKAEAVRPMIRLGRAT